MEARGYVVCCKTLPTSPLSPPLRTLGALCWEPVGPVIDFSVTEYELLREMEYFLSTADSPSQTTHPSLKSGVIRVPRDDRDPQIASQLEEVLRGCCGPAKMFTNISLYYNQEILRNKNYLSQLIVTLISTNLHITGFQTLIKEEKIF